MVFIRESSSFRFTSFLQISFYCFLPYQSRSILSLFIFSGWLRILLHIGDSWGLCWIWLNHHKWFWISFSWISDNSNLSRTLLYLIRSFLVWLHIQRNIHISIILIFWMCYFFIAQQSTLYIITGLMFVM
jgi:hypothetical protein